LALYNLAQAHMQAGQLERARRYVAKAVTLDPSDTQIRELAGKLGVVKFWQSVRLRLPKIGRLPKLPHLFRRRPKA